MVAHWEKCLFGGLIWRPRSACLCPTRLRNTRTSSRSLITLKTRKLALEMQVLGGREHLTSYARGWRPNSSFMHSNSILGRVYTFRECLICKVVSSLGFVFKCFCISSPSFWLTWICPESLTTFIFPLSSSSVLRKQSGDKIIEKYKLFFF